uniref:Uncharacterized protein n=1 Tax=Parascaris equorum TaxID=6256 RepID=A0A914RBC2_PAREQ
MFLTQPQIWQQSKREHLWASLQTQHLQLRSRRNHPSHQLVLMTHRRKMSRCFEF